RFLEPDRLREPRARRAVLLELAQLLRPWIPHRLPRVGDAAVVADHGTCTVHSAMPRGLRHLALRVRDVRAAAAFYRDHFAMRVVWQPDPANVYLSSGDDNLALHEVRDLPAAGPTSPLDHLGFVVDSADEVHRLADVMRSRGVPIVHAPRTHRDGSVSFYCHDPDENLVQVLWLPPALA